MTDWQTGFSDAVLSCAHELDSLTEGRSLPPSPRLPQSIHAEALVRDYLNGEVELTGDPLVHLAYCHCLAPLLDQLGEAIRDPFLATYFYWLFLCGYYEQVIALGKPYADQLPSRRHPAPPAWFNILNTYARTLRNLGRCKEALETHGVSIAHCRRFSMQLEEARQYLLVAKMWSKYFRLFGFYTLFIHKADAILSTQTGDPARHKRVLAMRYDVEGWVYNARGLETEAERCFRTAARLYGEIGRADGQDRVQSHLAMMLFRRATKPKADFQELANQARSLLQSSLSRMWRRPEAYRGLATRLGQLGFVKCFLRTDNLFEEGLSDLEKAISLARKCQDPRAEIGNLLRMVRVYREFGGGRQTSEELLVSAEKVAAKTALHLSQLEIGYERTSVALEQRDYCKAVTLFRQNQYLLEERMKFFHRCSTDKEYLLGLSLDTAEFSELQQGLCEDFNGMLKELASNNDELLLAMRKQSDIDLATIEMQVRHSVGHQIGKLVLTLRSTTRQVNSLLQEACLQPSQLEEVQTLLARIDQLADQAKQYDPDKKDVFQLKRRDAFQLKSVRLEELAQDVAQELGCLDRIHFITTTPFRLDCYPSIVSRALWHLLENCCDALDGVSWPKEQVGIVVEASATAEGLPALFIHNAGPNPSPWPSMDNTYDGRVHGLPLAKEILGMFDVEAEFRVTDDAVPLLGPNANTVVLRYKGKRTHWV